LLAILFDAGNTLIRQDYQAMADHLTRRGHRVTAAALEAAEQRARVRLDDGFSPGVSTEGPDVTRRYLALILEHLGIEDSAEVEAALVWRSTFNPPVSVWNQVDPAAEVALRRVKARGLVAGVVSNANGMIASLLAGMGLGRYLDFVIDSSVVGVEKPDARIFELALLAADVPAARAAYVGDLYSVDVLGARRAGLDAVLLDPGGFWGPRDCRMARTVAEAVDALLPPA
jgi:putative hydrolase of the HAD superfamily